MNDFPLLGSIAAAAAAAGIALAASPACPAVESVSPLPASSSTGEGSGAPGSVDLSLAGPVHATLRTWADGAWLYILDRDGAATGRLGRRGILQRFNVTTDDEYSLDLVSRSFTLLEDYRWHAADRGLRFAAASLNPRDLSDALDFKVRVPLDDDWSFEGAFTGADGPDLDRKLFRVALGRTLGRNLYARSAGTLGSVKPSADLELGIGWRSDDARSDVLIAGTLLDAFNDIVYVDIGVHPNHADTALVYERQPVSLRLAGEVAIGGHLRMEAYGALVRTATVRAFAQRSPLEGFRQREEYAFGGGLVEWAFSADLAAGITGSSIDAAIAREPLAEGTVEHAFRLEESESRVGVYGIARLHDRLRLESHLSRERRRERRVPDPDAELTSVDYEDRTWIGTLKAIHGGESGFVSIAAIDVDLRANVRGEGEVPTTFDALGNHNVRFRIDVGWRVPARAVVYLGAGYDLDGDDHSDPQLFDGGRARFVVTF